jgi:hypothetical protein
MSDVARGRASFDLDHGVNTRTVETGRDNQSNVSQDHREAYCDISPPLQQG